VACDAKCQCAIDTSIKQQQQGSPHSPDFFSVLWKMVPILYLHLQNTFKKHLAKAIKCTTLLLVLLVLVLFPIVLSFSSFNEGADSTTSNIYRAPLQQCRCPLVRMLSNSEFFIWCASNKWCTSNINNFRTAQRGSVNITRYSHHE